MANSPFASPRATIDVLERHGLATKKSLGQHLLVDDNIVGRILDLAELTGDEIVLEVGPGIGTLTVALCGRARAVVAVEVDTRLADVLSDTASECDELTLILGDAVKIPSDEIRTPFGSPEAFVANLPYSVAATLVLRFFQEIPSLRFAVVMVQAEVAARMAAEPGNKDYGSYTVKLRMHAKPVAHFPVPRNCFMPPPRVDSTVLRLERRDDMGSRESIADASKIADAAFVQRRKTLRNSLAAGLGAETSTINELLQRADIDGSLRAETLSVPEFMKIASFAREQGLLP